MQNPIAKMKMNSGAVIEMELYPEIAPNAVKSFISLAKKGVFDHYPIERVVPGWVLDISYHAFHKTEACYFIENDVKSGRCMEAVFGTVGLGGYGDPQISGGEFFFPLADCPRITGTYPIFAKVTRGLEELRRLEAVETYPVPLPDAPGVKLNTPVSPEFIESVEVETFGVEYGEPVREKAKERPTFWPVVLEP